MFLNTVCGICLIFYTECTQISGLKRSTLKNKVSCPNREALFFLSWHCKQNFLSSFWYELLFHNSKSRRAFHICFSFTYCFLFSSSLMKQKLTSYESKFGYSEAISISCLSSVYFKLLHLQHLTSDNQLNGHYCTWRKMRWILNGIYKEKEKKQTKIKILKVMKLERKRYNKQII